MVAIGRRIFWSGNPVSLLMLVFACFWLFGCSSGKHVPDGRYLLDKVSIRVDSAAGTDRLDVSEMQAYLRQTPNHKMLWSIKFRLGFYNLSGKDSSNWWNRWMRKLGEPPVIYDPALSDASADQLLNYLASKGYFNAGVSVDSIKNEKKKKIELTYNLTPGPQKIISKVDYEFPDSAVRNIVMADSSRFLTFPGRPLARDLLEAPRTMVADNLRNNVYYNFGKEYITFIADTTAGSDDAELL
ncbi:MAG: hypothetical protein K2H49_06025, partial [Muribaculaceae bacterium]|nr:hypothetical protein [Muribaculaceae bacterium]